MRVLRAAPSESTDRTSDIRPLRDQPADSGAFRRPRVLVVDHDHPTARQLALALEVDGVEAHTVASGADALAALESEQPIDLVLVELMLPQKSGLELAREIRARFPDVRIVLTGAYHLSERQLTRAGCNAIAFVPKPCDPVVVAAFVKEKALRPRR